MEDDLEGLRPLYPRRWVVLRIAMVSSIAFMAALITTGVPIVMIEKEMWEIRNADDAIDDGANYDLMVIKEKQRVQVAAVCSAIVASVVIAVFSQGVIEMSLLLVASHFLWVQPIWGFHHDYSLGIFVWLFLGSEGGFEVFPNVCGLPLSILVFWGLIRATRIQDSVPEFEKKEPCEDDCESSSGDH